MFRFVQYCYLCLLLLSACTSQPSEEAKTAIPPTGLRIAFYNVENLFDTQDDPSIDDEDFLPNSPKQWTAERYEQKLLNLAEVIAAMNYPALIGLAEIENEAVLQDLTSQEVLKGKGYQIVHDDSPDERGIDVALLYRSSFFTPFLEESVEVRLEDNDQTRDILQVGGTLGVGNDTLYLLVNHWPSRSGGEAASAPNRRKAALVARKAIDALANRQQDAKIVVMGDFNDEPTDRSLYRVLEANGKENTLDQNDLFNPMYALQQQDKGSYRYRDDWNMLDQIIVSQPLLSVNSTTIYYQPSSAHIFDDERLLQQIGRYAGHPNRTYAGDQYLGGYSDHLPVYIELGKK